MSPEASNSRGPKRIPDYTKLYMIRLTGFMITYALILVCGLTWARAGLPLWGRIGLAAATAAPICGVFWTIFRLLAECDDEYQKLLLVKQALLATAATLAIATVWQFLEVYHVLAEGPKWIGVLWLAALGLAAPIVRWRA
jgi:hypothetical protein